MNRRIVAVPLVLLFLGFLTSDAEAQLHPGIHAARAADAFGGANGVGGSLELSFPLLPVDVFVAGDYFFPDCGSIEGCKYMGGSADLHLRLPIPVLTPYGTAGLVYRRYEAGAGAPAESNTGFGLGAGVHLGTLVMGAYAEARYEFVDPDDQVVVRVGIRF